MPMVMVSRRRRQGLLERSWTTRQILSQAPLSTTGLNGSVVPMSDRGYSRAELQNMITAEGDPQRQLHARAAEIRDRVFGRTVVVRGVIELTNICRVNCDYCPMRRDNTRANAEYILEPEEILTAA